MKIYLFLMLVLGFFITSCDKIPTGREPMVTEYGASCNDIVCNENSSCIIINDEAICKCDTGYHPEEYRCVIDEVFTSHHLFVTGETKTIEENDDASTQRGIQRAYQEENDIITDLNTGLNWQNNEISSDRNWDEANNYCNTLNLNNLAWRLPNYKELLTIIDLKFTPAVNPIFRNITASKYWTSFGAMSTRYSVNLEDGTTKGLANTETHSVICVNGDFIWGSSSFEEQNTSDISKDYTTGITWYNSRTSKTWVEAISFCENLEIDNKTDWHLANINELQTLIYKNITQYYENWSSTISVNSNEAKTFSTTAITSIKDINTELNVRCVRSDKFGSYEEGKWGDIILNERYTIPNDAIFIDIRTESERSNGYPENSVGGAIYSYSDTEGFIADVNTLVNNDKDKHIIITCASGGRSGNAVEILSNAGFTYIEQIMGGTNKWKSLNLAWIND